MKTGLNHKQYKFPKLLPQACLLLFTGFHLPVNAQEKVPGVIKGSDSDFGNPAFIALLFIVLLLLVVIIIFAQVAKAGIHFRREQDRAIRTSNETLV
jgi:hypothetical protein